MTNRCILNIGRMTFNTEITVPPVVRALRGAGILWERWDLHVRDSEPILVVDCYANDHQVDLVATWLEQDCIAVWDLMHREGRLVGPRSADWGEFDPAMFLLPNGSRLAEARSVAA